MADLHELVDIVEIVQDAALHEHYVKIAAVAPRVDFQHIAHFITDIRTRGPGELHGISAVVLRNVEYRHLRAQQGQRNSLFPAGAAQIGHTDALIAVKVGRKLFQHAQRIRHGLFGPLGRRAGVGHPEIIGGIFPGFLVLGAVVLGCLLFHLLFSFLSGP